MANRLSGNNSNYLENLDAPTFKSFATDDASSVDDSWFDRRKETPTLKQGDIYDEKQHNNGSLANNDKNLSTGSSVAEKAGKEEICCQLDVVTSPLMREKSYEVITTKKANDFMKGNIIEPVELVGRSPVEYLEKRTSGKPLQVRRIMKNKSSTVGDTNQKAECPMQLQSEKRELLSKKIQPTTTPTKDQCRKNLGTSISEIEKAVISKLVITKSEISKASVTTVDDTTVHASGNKACKIDQPYHVGAQQHTPLVAPKNPVHWKQVISKPNDQKRQVKQFSSAKTEGRIKVGSLKPLRVLANKHDGKKATQLPISKATSNQQNVAKLDNNNASVQLNIPGFQEGSSTKCPANERTPEKQRGNHQLKRAVPAWAHSPNVGLRLGQKKALTKPMPFQFGNRSNSAVLSEKLSVQSSKTIKPVVINKQPQSAQKLTITRRVSSTRTVTQEFRFATEERCRHYLEKEKMSKNTQTAADIPSQSQKLNSAKRVQPSVHSSVRTVSTVVGDVKKSHVQTTTATPKMISSKARLYDDYVKQRKDQWKQAELKGQNQQVQKKPPTQQRQQPGPSKARPFKQNKKENE
ncbi:hypothetical protein T4A_4005 [Trichinella pseudospiralis]|uniref:Uncharacterized protein n=1 Tax=Trichinella pseudospiralis TaxID=6337 RepID=A0A0V1E5T5_TRIPS|nr:hypothetical protein T4A_4005 [Trichinella pseudospiralis]